MRQKLEEDNADLVRMFPLPQARHLFIFFNQRRTTCTLQVGTVYIMANDFYRNGSS